MKTRVTRRQFLKGLGVAGVTAGVVSTVPSMTGCAGPARRSESTGSFGEWEQELIWQTQINPQDYSYRGHTVSLDTLLSPVSVGPMTSSHRMVKSAAGSATYLAGYTDELFEYYVNLARGGVEIIWIEGEAFSPGPDGSLSAEAQEFGRRLSNECASLGTHLGYQWAVFGLGDIKDMSIDQIKATQTQAVGLAQTLVGMGFKGIEINAAGFNVGEHFLSRFHNTRTDEYGCGSIENRARFVVECIAGIKSACGDNLAVQVLIDCIEENDNLSNDATLMTLDNAVTSPHNLVTTVEEGIALAKEFEKAGADSIHLRLGPLANHPCQFASDLYFILNGLEGATGYGTQWDFSRHFEGALIGNHSGAGMLLNIARRYKEALSIPCGVVTYMDPAHAPDFFERALKEGCADFYLMTRPLTVDTEYVNKIKANKIDEIAPCTRCLHCHIGSNEMNAAMGYCRVNALTQRVMREGGPATYELPALESKKRVMVVGGGPAGMEAARIAALRGHTVSLWEQEQSLGGSLTFASSVKGPHENLDDLRDYLVRQVELSGVEVHVGQFVTSEIVSQQAPDVLIVATGGVIPDKPAMPQGVNVVKFSDFMTAELGDQVVIFGSNAQAFDAALWCTVHKKQVTIVTPHKNEELDMQQSMHAMRFMTSALYALGVHVWTESYIESSTEKGLIITTGFGTKQVIPCESIIVGAEFEPNPETFNEAAVPEVHVIGDAQEPFNIALAIRAGNDIGRTI